MFQKVDEIGEFCYKKCKQFIKKPFPIIILLAIPITWLIFHLVSLYLNTDKLTDEKDIIQVKQYILKFTSQIFLGVAGLFTAFSAWQRVEVSREGQITDRFTRAVDQLDSKNLEVRLGGIYALERIAKDSPKDHDMILEMLAAYFRQKAQKGENYDLCKLKEQERCPDLPTKPLSTDMQAILTIIGRREWAIKKEPDLSGVDLHQTYIPDVNLFRADLRNSYLFGARLLEADLREACLTFARLSRAVLDNANLSKADLRYSNLDGVRLRNADLSGADLTCSLIRPKETNESDSFGPHLVYADLSGANFSSANLSGADLSGANFSSANLSGANLSDANLRDANLEGNKTITPDQIKKAKHWKEADYSDDIAAQLGLSIAPEESAEKPEEQPPSQN